MSAHAASCRISPKNLIRILLIPSMLMPGIQTLQAQPDELTFAFTGDIMMGTTYPDSLYQTHLPANNGKELLKAPLDILRQADFTAGNLEGTLLEQGGSVKESKDPNLHYAFRTPPHYVDNLLEAGFDFVSLANNHSNDFGTEGLRSTQKTLKKAGIAYAGLKGLCETTVVTRKGIRFGIAAFSHNALTPHLSHLKKVRHTVSELRRKCDYVIVSFHGGAEGTKFTRVPHSREYCFGEDRGDVCAFARTCIDAGANLVYGHGPHVVRAIELYKDRLIAYSLGNFCTPYRINITGRSGYAPVLTVTTTRDGKFVKGQIHSFIQQHGRGPQRDKTHRAATEIAELTQQDFPQTPVLFSPDGHITRR